MLVKFLLATGGKMHNAGSVCNLLKKTADICYLSSYNTLIITIFETYFFL